jgi:hypothetical protein
MKPKEFLIAAAEKRTTGANAHSVNSLIGRYRWACRMSESPKYINKYGKSNLASRVKRYEDVLRYFINTGNLQRNNNERDT